MRKQHFIAGDDYTQGRVDERNRILSWLVANKTYADVKDSSRLMVDTQKLEEFINKGARA